MLLHGTQHGEHRDDPATARAAANRSHRTRDARVPRGTASAGDAANVTVRHTKFASIAPGLRRDLNGERDGEKYRVMNNLEDRTYAREGCKSRWRSAAPATPMQKKKEHPRRAHPDPSHGRHNLYPAVWPWHIQAPDVLEGKKEQISRVSMALETSWSHHGLDGIAGGNPGSLLGNRRRFAHGTRSLARLPP